MMPGAGLYLPETLSQSLHNHEEFNKVRQQVTARKTSQESDPESRSATFTRSISEDMSKAFSSLSTVFDFADWASSQGKSSSESEVFVNLIQRVRNDVTEALRLSTSSTAVTDYFEAWPDKKIWIDSIIQDVQKALNDIGVFMDTVRVSGDDGGTVGLGRKYHWVMSHHKKLVNKQQYLMLCHQSLMAAVQVMQTAEMRTTFDPIYELPGPSLVRDSPGSVLRSPRSRQKIRMNQKNASIPSITVSELEINNPVQDYIDYYGINARPYRHALAELPGSTPDGLSGLIKNDSRKYTYKRRSRSMDEGRIVPINQPEGIDRQRFEPPTTRAISMIKEVKPSADEKPPEPPIYRGSFDIVRPSTTSLFEDRAQASFEQARPRSKPDQVILAKVSNTESRAPRELVNTLPNVAENLTERLNSNASKTVNDVLSMSPSSVNDRPKPVHIETYPVKHRSVPSKLPSLASQTSLMEDLSYYVDPQPTQDTNKSIDGVDTCALLHEDTPVLPTVSITVMPEPSAPCSSLVQIHEPVTLIAALEDGIDSLKDLDTTSLQPSDQSSIPAQPFREAPLPLAPPQRPPTAPIFPAELETPSKTSASKQEEGGATHLSAVSNSPPITLRRPVAPVDSPANGNKEQNGRTASSSSRVCLEPSFASSSNEAADSNFCEGRSAAEGTQNCHSDSAGSALAGVPDKGTLPQSLPLKVSRSLPQVAALPGTTLESTASLTRPLTAQAKRRAAHARRMELAFGSEN